jgi:pimeloyl-ACP methyl ester carboxylesterase
MDRFETWAAAYLATDPDSGERSPPAVEVPSGADADFADAWSGNFPYDPSALRVPTMVVRGEWDAITRDADAAWLAKVMRNVPGGVRDVKLSGGAHRMHLEVGRQRLFDAVAEFLAEAAQ